MEKSVNKTNDAFMTNEIRVRKQSVYYVHCQLSMLVAFWSGLFCGITLPPLPQRDCTIAQEKEVIVSVGARGNSFSSQHKSLFSSPRLEVSLQRYVKYNCTRSSTVFCHQRTAGITVLMSVMR